MIDYDRAMLHVELALRRASAALRKRGETSIEDAMWMLANEIADLNEKSRRERSQKVEP